MKKNFSFSQANKHPDRVIESIKYDIRRYLKRERKKKLPDDAAFWEFKCKFGKNEQEAEAIKASDIISSIDAANAQGWDGFYIEVLAKPSEKKRSNPPEKS